MGIGEDGTRDDAWRRLPGAQALVDPEGRILCATPGFSLQLGLRRDPSGFEFATFVSSQDRRAWRTILEGDLVEDDGRHSLRMVRSDGTVPWMDLVWHRWADGLSLLLEDITAHHRLEERLRQRDRRAALGRLAEGVLRDVARHVGRALQALEQPATGDETPLDPRDLLHQGMRQIQAFQESARQGRPSNVEGVDIDDALRKARPLFLAALGDRRKLVVSCSGPSRWVRCEPALLEHMLLHLALWGAERTPTQGVLLIEVKDDVLDVPRALPDGSWIEQGAWTVLHLVDQGAPLGDEALETALDPYPAHGARGLLAPVQEAVRRFGGHAILSCVPGAGVEVRIFLPPFPVVESSASAQALKTDSVVGPSILVVEDRRDVLHTFVRILEMAGYEVAGTTDPFDAVRLSRQTVFDLVVTDLDMPGMGGLQLIRELREDAPGLPALVVSGYGDPGDLPPRSEFLHKPIEADALLRLVRQSLHAS